ncbi:MAG: metallophosphoesterase [Ignavibacteria bacterium]
MVLFIVCLITNAQTKNENESSVTFFVVADTHFDPPPETDQYYHIVAMNTVCGTIDNIKASTWQEKIMEENTYFGSVGEPIEEPNGVIMAGDITDRAEPSSLKLLKKRYEKGPGDKVINFPVYVGLGNHDLDLQHVGDGATAYRNYMLEYVAERHSGKNVPVPVTNFDNKSKNYSWDWGKLHLVQTHRFAGNTENGNANSIEWLSKDLKYNASNGKPVIIIQHYAFYDGANRWWSEEEKETLYSVIKDYNIVAIINGHIHEAENFKWKGINIFQVNNAWPDDDGNGSFLICKITAKYMDVVTCRWKDGNGNVELVEPSYHEEF